MLELVAADGVVDNDIDVDGTPITDFSGLAITEINYHPTAPTDAELLVD